MNDRELYQQKMKAQLDGWRADLDKLKARASGATADVQLDINRHTRTLERKIDEGKSKLSELHAANEEAWESVKKGVESAWGSLKTGFSDAADRFKG